MGTTAERLRVILWSLEDFLAIYEENGQARNTTSRRAAPQADVQHIKQVHNT